jgi:hypothetical protein
VTVTPGSVARLSAIDFGRGSEALYRDQMPGLLTELADRARVQSITASSAITLPPSRGPTSRVGSGENTTS